MVHVFFCEQLCALMCLVCVCLVTGVTFWAWSVSLTVCVVSTLRTVFQVYSVQLCSRCVAYCVCSEWNVRYVGFCWLCVLHVVSYVACLVGVCDCVLCLAVFERICERFVELSVRCETCCVCVCVCVCVSG